MEEQGVRYEVWKWLKLWSLLDNNLHSITLTNWIRCANHDLKPDGDKWTTRRE